MKSYAAAILLPLKMKERFKPRNEGSFYNLKRQKTGSLLEHREGKSPSTESHFRLLTSRTVR